MKKSELLFNLFSIPLDALMIIFAAIASFYFRANTTDFVGPFYIGPAIYNLNLNEFIPQVLKALPLLILLLAIAGLYNLNGTRNLVRELGKIFIAVSGGLFFIIVAFFFDQAFFPSRFIILSTWVLSIVFVFLGRVIISQVQQFAFRKGFGLHKVVVINGNSGGNKFDKIFQNTNNGYEIIEQIDYASKGLEYLKNLVAKEKVDEIIQTNPSLGEKVNLEILEFSRSKGLHFSFVPNLFEAHRNSVQVWEYEGVPLISVKNSPLEGWGSVAKRILDILASFLSLIICLPLFLIIWFLIRLDSKGPAIYGAKRVGNKGEFQFYKFRTMYAHMSVGENFGGEEAERLRQELWEKNERGDADGLILKVKNDPRVTRVGKFLRKTKLDEIPQFWNVFLGNMSMVGPRAHVLDEVSRYREKYARMFSVKPGIFGLAQTAQVFRPNLPFEEEVRLNIFYIENWSLWLDVKILARSFYLLFFEDKPSEDY